MPKQGKTIDKRSVHERQVDESRGRRLDFDRDKYRTHGTNGKPNVTLNGNDEQEARREAVADQNGNGTLPTKEVTPKESSFDSEVIVLPITSESDVITNGPTDQVPPLVTRENIIFQEPSSVENEIHPVLNEGAQMQKQRLINAVKYGKGLQDDLMIYESIGADHFHDGVMKGIEGWGDSLKLSPRKEK